MSEIEKIILTSGLTVFGGVIVFVVGQLVTKFLIEPIYEQSKLIGEIAASLIYYANVGSGIENIYIQGLANIENQEGLGSAAKELLIERQKSLVTDEWERDKEARRSLRRQASELIGKTNAIPFYRLWVVLSLGNLPTKKGVVESSHELIGLSNEDKNRGSKIDRPAEIAKNLRIRDFR